MERNLRKTRVGKVVSNKMDKTIVVAIEVLTEQPRRAGDFPAQEDRMLGWRWNLAGMFGKRQTARRKKRGRISVRGCF